MQWVELCQLVTLCKVFTYTCIHVHLCDRMTLCSPIIMFLISVMWYFRSALKYTLASFQGSFQNLGERTWYLLFAYVLNFLTYQEFQIIPCYIRVTWHQVREYWRTSIFNHTLLTMTICVQHLDSGMLYAFLPRSDSPQNLKRKHLWSIYPGCWWVLASYILCYEVKAYICGVKIILYEQPSSSNKPWC